VRRYSENFKAKMIKKVLAPPGRSAISVAHEAGISQSALSRWLKQSGSISGMGDETKDRRPNDWTPAEKLSAVIESSQLTGDELGAFLRRKGLHEEDLKSWRAQAEASFEGDQTSSRKSGSDKKRIKELERKLTKAEKKLRASEAIVELQKKVSAWLAEEDDDIAEKSGKES
jgi:transposase